MPELNGATKWFNRKVAKHELIGEKATLIHFWSISCPLCKEDMQAINEFHKQFKEKLNVIAVHTPRSEQDLDVQKVEKTAEQLKMMHSLFIDHHMKLSDAFENEYVPAYYLFDREGKLRYFQTGESSLNLLTKRVHRMLK